ncbi:MAG: transglutaminase-like domain-containing protein [Lachnospiraceae bacterium]|nr:transglutaminase-like domain-containing protein [Lachnospiraceae bacterium]
MKKGLLTTSIVSICSMLLMSCAQNTTTSTVSDSSTVSLADEPVASFASLDSGTRSNTPVCLVPTASGVTVYSNALAAIDASNASEGYIMVNYKGTNPKVKLQITGANGVTYTYNLHGGYETFPLSSGDGSYKVAVYENVTGNQYSTALSQTIKVTITNVFGPNLYPNQYVNFNMGSQVVSEAMQLAQSCNTDLEVVTKVYNYVTSNISYDHNKAANVQSGYTSNVDEILLSGTGICLDYAAVMASMLRSQNIPTRLEVGYAGSAYHAWISTYITDIGWVNGIIEFDGANWSLMDPTFAANSSETALKNFIGNGSNYKTKYIY